MQLGVRSVVVIVTLVARAYALSYNNQIELLPAFRTVNRHISFFYIMFMYLHVYIYTGLYIYYYIVVRGLYEESRAGMRRQAVTKAAKERESIFFGRAR